MEITMDKSGRIVVPKDLRDALGMEDGGTFDISRYGNGLHLEPHGRRARVVERDGRLVLTSDHVVTDEEMYGLIDAFRR
jgi:AbrB family looped-hinge helix DNA binding protein